MKKQTLSISEESHKSIVTLPGTIDENFKFDFVDKLQHEEVILDCRQLQLISSFGIREMIIFISSLSAKRVSYINCPCILVNQFNMVRGLICANTRVLSFYAPYYASVGHEEMEILLEVEDVKNAKAPKQIHPETKEELVFDDLEERYFSFLKLLPVI